jgi:hypothetical protein
MRIITACFARVHQRYTGRISMGFLFILPEGRPIGKTRNQLNVKLSAILLNC